jgi:hypothetical protein
VDVHHNPISYKAIPDTTEFPDLGCRCRMVAHPYLTLAGASRSFLKGQSGVGYELAVSLRATGIERPKGRPIAQFRAAYMGRNMVSDERRPFSFTSFSFTSTDQ